MTTIIGEMIYRGNRIVAFTDEGMKTLDNLPRPYAFILPKHLDKLLKLNVDVEGTNLRNEHGQKVVKFIGNKPSKIKAVRSKFPITDTFEADIPYLQRVQIDKAVIIKPVNTFYIDIEVDDSKGFPKERGKYKILCVTIYDEQGNYWTFYVGDYDNEREMLADLSSFFDYKRIGLVAGWNVGFDIEHLRARAHTLGLHNNTFDLVSALDIYNIYKKEVKGLSKYTLAEVVEHEKLGVKVRDKPVSQMTREEMIEYNRNDTELVYLIDQKYGFTSMIRELSNFVNLTINTLYPDYYQHSAVRLATALIGRRFRELGYVMRNVITKGKQKYLGALVLEPQPGLYKDVSVFDFESLYPSVIINEKVDVNGFHGEVLPHVLKDLYELRLEYKRLSKLLDDPAFKMKQYALKIVINSLYGVLGNPYFRYYDPRKAQQITQSGKAQLLKAIKIVEGMGYKVLYSDTDSLFILNVDDPQKLEEELNKRLAPYRIKFEKRGKVLFLIKTGSKGSSSAKKHYVFRLEDGSYIYKGIELARSDWDGFTKTVTCKIYDMIFEGASKQDILHYLAVVKRELFRGKHDKMLIMSKGIQLNKKYQKEDEHVKAYKKMLKRGWYPTNMRVYYVYYNRDVEPLNPLNPEKDVERFKGRLDYDRYWRRLENAVNRAIKSAFSRKMTTLSVFMK